MITTTGIGSLPYSNIYQAIEHSLSYDLPFLPQLFPWNTFERMDLQTIENQDFVVGYQDWLSPKVENYTCLIPFINKLKSEKKFNAKMQITGPMTVLRCFPKYSDMSDQILNFIQKKMTYFYHLFELEGIKLQIWIDEPFIVYEDNLSLVTKLIDKLQTSLPELKIGLHCCNQANWIEILNLPIDVLSFDAHLSWENLKTAFFNTKIKPLLAIGIFPSVKNNQLDETLFLWKKIKAELTINEINDFMVSANCGHAFSDIKWPEKSLHFLQNLAL